MFETFILISDPNFSAKRTKYTYTLSGEHYFPLEKPLPVIISGKGCFSLGIITEYTVSKTGTTIEFTQSSVSKQDGKAYYALFKNTMAVSDQDDYEQTDTLIPGMVGSVASTSDCNEVRYENHGSVSLSDYLDDNW